MWEAWVRPLGWEDPLEEGVAIHLGILAWRIPVDRGTWGCKESDMTELLSTAQRFVLGLKVKVKSLSRVRLFATSWAVACTRLLRPWDFLGKSTGVGCHFLLQRIFPTQGSNPGLLHCRQTPYHLSHQGSGGFRLCLMECCGWCDLLHRWFRLSPYQW